MKTILFSAMMLAAQQLFSQDTLQKKNKPAKSMIVETSCGQCQLGLKGNGCDLAVRIHGKSYFVDGTGIADHGDAHARDGFCNAIRKAEVTGEVVKGRFKASSFKLIPFAEK